MKILVLSRHYPPAVSGLAPRVSGLVAALVDAGAEVFVVAPGVPAGSNGLAVPHPNRDPSDAPAAGRPSVLAVAREVLLWPDPDIRWAMRAARAALVEMPWKPDWILSASPPESVHVAASWLSRKCRTRWAADFTDLWLKNPHRRERLHPVRRTIERIIAQWLVPRADIALAVDGVVAAELASFGAKCPHVLPHFPSELDPIVVELPAERVNVVFTGAFSLSAPENDIRETLGAFSLAQQRNPALMLHLVGRLTTEERSAVDQCRARSAIVVYGVREHREAIGFQHAADALLFSNAKKLHVPPSKIVEYLRLDKPIVAIGEGEWRSDPRVPQGDPVELMANLKKGDKQWPPLPRPPSADETASTLLALMRGGE